MWLFESLCGLRTTFFDPYKIFLAMAMYKIVQILNFMSGPLREVCYPRATLLSESGKSKNRDSENESLVRSGGLRSFLGEY